MMEEKDHICWRFGVENVNRELYKDGGCVKEETLEDEMELGLQERGIPRS